MRMISGCSTAREGEVTATEILEPYFDAQHRGFADLPLARLDDLATIFGDDLLDGLPRDLFQFMLRTAADNQILQTFSLVYGTQNNRVETSIWDASLKDEYTFTPHIGLYALGAFDRNTFAGIDRRFDKAHRLQPKAHHLAP